MTFLELRTPEENKGAYLADWLTTEDNSGGLAADKPGSEAATLGACTGLGRPATVDVSGELPTLGTPGERVATD